MARRSAQVQRTLAAEVAVAEGLDVVAEAMGQRHQQPVVRRLLELSERPIWKSSPPPTSTNGMLSSVCELPLPSSLVQTMSVLSSRLPSPPGSGVSAEPLGEVGQLLAVPVVDLGELLHAPWYWSPVRATGRGALRRCRASASSRRRPSCVYCSVAMRAKSLTKLFTMSSICMRLIVGHVVVLVLRRPVRACGAGWPDLASARPRSSSSSLADERGLLVEQAADLRR